MSNPVVSPRNATVHNVFVGEGRFDLRLPIGLLEDLQDITGVGPQMLLHRLGNGQWKVKDVTETIRLALIGGGLAKEKAYAVVQRNIKEGYLGEYVLIAFAALSAAILAPADDPATTEENEPGEHQAAPKDE